MGGRQGTDSVVWLWLFRDIVEAPEIGEGRGKKGNKVVKWYGTTRRNQSERVVVKWACAGPGVTRKEEEPLGQEEGAELVGLWREDDGEGEMESVGRRKEKYNHSYEAQEEQSRSYVRSLRLLEGVWTF